MSNTAFSNNNGGGIWCRIAGGKITRNATEETPGAVKQEKKNKDGTGTGQYKYVLLNDAVEGRIEEMRIGEKEFGGETVYQLEVKINHQGERIIVTMKQGDRYWRSFMCRLQNLDMKKPVKFAPFDFVGKDGNTVIGMSLYQDGVKVAPYITREESRGMPEVDKVMFKGKERFDFSRQDDWLNSEVMMPIAKSLSSGAPIEDYDDNPLG